MPAPSTQQTWVLLPSAFTVNGSALVSACYVSHTYIRDTSCRDEDSGWLSWGYGAGQMPLAQG